MEEKKPRSSIVWRAPSAMAFLAVIACKAISGNTPGPEASVQEFAPYEQKKVVQVYNADHPLAHLHTIDEINTVPKIRYTVSRLAWSVHTPQSIEVMLHDLSPEQCRAVRAAYGNLSHIRCEQKGDYSLIDFMPPAMQALNQSNFRDERLGKQELQTNCWSTAYELLRRNWQSYLLTFMDGNTVKDTILANSDQKFSGDGEKASQWIAQNSQFMDALLVEVVGATAREEDMGAGNGSLAHAALIIDRNGLLFEKQAIDSWNGFHFIDFDTLSKRGKGNFRLLHPRNAMPARQNLSPGWKSRSNGCVRIPITEDAQGRSSFPAWTHVQGALSSRMKNQESCNEQP